MKILVVGQYFFPENFRINSVVEELVKIGHNVTVLTGYPNYPEGEFYEGYEVGQPYDDNYKGAKVVRIKMFSRKTGKVNLTKNYFSFCINAIKWVRKNGKNYDITYSCQLSPVFATLPCITAKKKFGIPTVINVQDLWPESFAVVMGINNKIITKPLAILSNRVYKNADKLLCSSKAYIENMEARGISKDKLVYWPQYSMDLEATEQDCPVEYITKYRYVFTGNIGEAQGLDIIIDSAILTKDNIEIGYYIVGDGSDKARLISKVESLGLTNIYFVDRQPESAIPKYLENATSAILTLKENILSKTVIPAKLQMYMTCGCPVICTIQGVSNIEVDNANCGIVCEENTGEELAKAVIIMSNLDNNKIKELGINGKKYCNEYFDKDKLIQELNEIIIEVGNK